MTTSLRELEKRLAQEPDNLPLRVTVAGMLRESGRAAEAVEHYRRVAIAYRALGRQQQAIAVCRSILELAPADIAIHALLAELTEPKTPVPAVPGAKPATGPSAGADATATKVRAAPPADDVDVEFSDPGLHIDEPTRDPRRDDDTDDEDDTRPPPATGSRPPASALAKVPSPAGTRGAVRSLPAGSDAPKSSPPVPPPVGPRAVGSSPPRSSSPTQQPLPHVPKSDLRTPAVGTPKLAPPTRPPKSSPPGSSSPKSQPPVLRAPPGTSSSKSQPPIVRIPPKTKSAPPASALEPDPPKVPPSRPSFEIDTPLPRPIPYHIADPTSSQMKLAREEAERESHASPALPGGAASPNGDAEWLASPALPGGAASPNGDAEWLASPALPGGAASPNGDAEWIDDALETRPGEQKRTRLKPETDTTGLAQAARRISGLISPNLAGAPKDLDLSAELDTRQRPRLSAEDLAKVHEPPPTVPTEQVVLDDELPTPLPRVAGWTKGPSPYRSPARPRPEDAPLRTGEAGPPDRPPIRDTPMDPPTDVHAALPPVRDTKLDVIREDEQTNPVDLLGANPISNAFFTSLPPNRRDSALARCIRRDARADSIVVRQGESAHALILVVSGQLEVRYERANGSVVVLDTIQPGQYIGEAALLGRTPAQASVFAVEDSDLLALPPHALFELAGAFPALWAALKDTAERRTRQYEKLIRG